MKYHFLLDNNIYRPLMASENGVFIKNFKNSIEKHTIIKNITHNNLVYSITPFSILEALGITIPYSKNLIYNEKTKAYKEGFKNLKKQAENYFENLEILKIQNLLNAAEKQSIYTNSESKELEKTLIFNPLKTEGFYKYLLKGVVFDYLCKYEFPQETQKQIFSEFLIPTFFLNDRDISRFSKFRIIKRLWDNSYYGLEKSTILENKFIKKLNQAMKLKRNKDFLDCEIIHFSTIGDLVNENHNPVFSFTTDKKETVINRIIVYKSMINLFINNLLTIEQYENYKHLINNWRQGMIIFCDKEGHFKESIDISNIKAINER